MSILSAGERLRKRVLRIWRAANERMQLTWLIGAPGRPVSVHQRAVGRGGLGSSATQLMRAVRRSQLQVTIIHFYGYQFNDVFSTELENKQHVAAGVLFDNGSQPSFTLRLYGADNSFGAYR